MSVAYDASIPVTQTPAASSATPADLAARIDRLPTTKSLWKLVALIALGAWFEAYDLFFTGYIAPGLAKSGILTETTQSFFGFAGIGAFVAVTFAGLFIGTFFLGFLSDRYGRRFVFTYALLWYTAAAVIMACQTSTEGLLVWRFIAGIGIGVELITIDAYISEMVPRHMRGRAFAFYSAIAFSSVPIIALLSWQLVPIAPFDIEGWRWVVVIGSVGAIIVWYIRRVVPESPLWLAQNGRGEEADRIVALLESEAIREFGRPLRDPTPSAATVRKVKAGLSEVFRPPYRSRLIMLVVFNLCQVIGYYGFANWVPSLLVAKGIGVTKGLAYAAIIAVANPLGPLLGMTFADRVDRKWVIVGSALVVAMAGAGFSQFTEPGLLIFCGVLITLANTILSYAYHAYQVEMFPTAIRARAGGIAYSSSRFGAIWSGFLIAFFLRDFGATGAFGLITACMLGVVFVIGVFGPSNKEIDSDQRR
ncbi:MFS transporter [Bradyrhizobium sp. 30]|uniref:MFS transporter n=1 Tax=Bradyrhizobium sp. 30 TaxID=2782669 RepID=UPI001FFA90F6|nr:MFS transporter [Bradyrhizobium sp. 30]MCK1290878.1 MFS transporter [Bradyrhizobium sp. 30]